MDLASLWRTRHCHAQLSPQQWDGVETVLLLGLSDFQPNPKFKYSIIVILWNLFLFSSFKEGGCIILCACLLITNLAFLMLTSLENCFEDRISNLPKYGKQLSSLSSYRLCRTLTSILPFNWTTVSFSWPLDNENDLTRSTLEWKKHVCLWPSNMEVY